MPLIFAILGFLLAGPIQGPSRTEIQSAALAKIGISAGLRREPEFADSPGGAYSGILARRRPAPTRAMPPCRSIRASAVLDRHNPLRLPARVGAPPIRRYTAMTRQRENEEYEPRQLDYDTGLPMTEATRQK